MDDEFHDGLGLSCMWKLPDINGYIQGGGSGDSSCGMGIVMINLAILYCRYCHHTWIWETGDDWKPCQVCGNTAWCEGGYQGEDQGILLVCGEL